MTDPNQPTPVAGLVVLDKPLAISSARAVAIVKRRLRNAGLPKSIKVGHAGTLDPLASGVLLVLVGKATRLQDRFMAGEKRYLADIDLAAFTTTDDAEGERDEVTVESPPTREHIDRVLADHFTGTIQQTPPAFSAIKLGGRRAYAEARSGKPVQLEPRPVTIHEIAITAYVYPRLTLDIRCAKGTYIRSIARDLGHALHTGGTLAALRRTGVGPFTIDQAITLENLPDPLRPDHLTTTPETRALLKPRDP
ncbi:MAG: tRNA pseudouridine(55) synthase TruB [Phycisphaerales bacterium JB040]